MHACGNWLHDLPLYIGLGLLWVGAFGRGTLTWLRSRFRRPA